jgi:hypothetical protein
MIQTVWSYNTATELKGFGGVLSKLWDPKNRRTVEKMIPSVRMQQDHCTGADSKICIEDGEIFSVRETYPDYKITGINPSPVDILALTEYVLERGRQEKGIYNLHSSAVGLEDRCVIINGGSKSGKTLISLYVMENLNKKFLTNERALIELRSSSLVGGCNTLDLFSYHRKRFNRLYGMEELDLEKISSPYTIEAIVQPVIDSGIESAEVILVDPPEAEWTLYPEFTGRIRGDNRRLRGDNYDLTYPLDSLDTKELAMQRMLDLKTFLSKTPFYFLRGNLESIGNFILGKLECK